MQYLQSSCGTKLNQFLTSADWQQIIDEIIIELGIQNEVSYNKEYYVRKAISDLLFAYKCVPDSSINLHVIEDCYDEDEDELPALQKLLNEIDKDLTWKNYLTPVEEIVDQDQSKSKLND